MAQRGWLLFTAGLVASCSGGAAMVTTGGGTSSSSASSGAGGSGGSVIIASSSSSSSSSGGGSIPVGDASTDVVDAGPVDLSMPAIPCTDSIADVYSTPPSLPPMTNATRGDVVWCAFDSTLPLATVTSETTGKGVMTPMTTGVSLYRVAFRTTRGDGSAGLSSARVYLPITSAKQPLPIITVGHPTDGLAQSCAPSTDPTSNEDLALPWAGLGYVVIVPDYAGLGNGGVQSYLDNFDQAYSVLDGARALRKMLPAAGLSQSVVAAGWSQGGGAVLSAQALAKTYGCDGNLVGVVAFAPEWPTRLNSFGFVSELLNPNELTIQTGISEDVVTVMRQYAYFTNRVGAPLDGGDGFPANAAAGIDNAVETECQTPLGGYLQVTAPHIHDIFDPTFAATTLDCITNQADGGYTDAGNPWLDGGADPGCVDPGKSFYQFLVNNFVTADPSGATVLFVQGLADVIMPPASEAACNLDKLHADGVFPQVCVDAQAQHTNVVGRNMDFAMSWMFALLADQPLPMTCTSSGIPACTP